MPTIARFYGITIRMCFGEHPPPHFHATYAEGDALIRISTGEILEGSLPPTARRLVAEWTKRQSRGAPGNWERGGTTGRFERIPYGEPD